MPLSLEAPAARAAGLTTSELETVELIWTTGGLPPISGYATAILAVAVASDPALISTLTAVDFNDVESVEAGVAALLRWREGRTGFPDVVASGGSTMRSCTRSCTG
jgi:hypothetical protein